MQFESKRVDKLGVAQTVVVGDVTTPPSLCIPSSKTVKQFNSEIFATNSEKYQ